MENVHESAGDSARVEERRLPKHCAVEACRTILLLTSLGRYGASGRCSVPRHGSPAEGDWTRQMKKCAYCGRENGDDATSCRECGTPEFVATSSAPAQSVAEEASQECGATTAIKECVAEATTSLSERWRPKTAWLCLLFLVAALIPLGFFYLAMVDKHSDQRGFYTDNQLGILGILIGIVTFTVTTSFSGVRTVRQFKESFALLRVSRECIAVAAAAGVLIQVVTIYVFAGGLSHLQRRTSFNLLLLAALLAPFFEEPFFRG